MAEIMKAEAMNFVYTYDGHGPWDVGAWINKIIPDAASGLILQPGDAVYLTALSSVELELLFQSLPEHVTAMNEAAYKKWHAENFTPRQHAMWLREQENR